MACLAFVCLTILSAVAAVFAAPANTGCVTLSAPTDGAVQTVHLISRQLLAVFTCDEGYAAVGETILSCVDGEWDKIPPLCASVKHCNLRTIKKKKVDPSLLKCGQLSEPRYGGMDVKIGEDGFSEIATFNCAPGYYVSGSSALHCEKGVWDGREPECKPIDCGAPDAPLNGIVEFEDTRFMRIAHYKCDACHALKGYETRVCKRSGLWSKTTPECRPANDTSACPIPDIPGGGFIPNENSLVQNGVACGQVIEINCFSGWRLIGADTATCNPDGTYFWHGVIPRCRRLRWT
ncbi:sushi, von Willebrand factor type A, EGF and pentraxin domain-containing protein 1-like [Halichondria panicea]|uniref:sushi, von Willebrand factor type A, EGF and pentraxin domain-containing protein 1-like n=1 Tax=Halichondria panicea TaxID=6063 RepID=UPI00312BA6FB